jgi:HEAT repeat protein
LWAATTAVPQKGDQKKKDPPKKDLKSPPDKKVPPLAEEPTETTRVGGKTVKEWIDVDLHSKDASIRERAMQVIPTFGPKLSMRALLQIVKELSSADAGVRTNAAMAIGAMLTVQHPDDEKVMKKVVSALKARLESDSQTIVLYRVAEALVQVGRDASSCVYRLCALAREPPNRELPSTWEMRRAACLALGALAYDAEHKTPEERAIKALSFALSDSCVQVRLAAMQALLTLGPPRAIESGTKVSNPGKVPGVAKPPTPPITHSEVESLIKTILTQLDKMARGIKDHQEAEKVWANLTYMRIDNKLNDKRMAAIGSMLRSEDPSVKCQAAQALAMIGSKASAQVELLREGLSDKEDDVVGACLLALGAMGRDAMPAMSRIEQIARDSKNPSLKSAAQDAAKSIQGNAKAGAAPKGPPKK